MTDRWREPGVRAGVRRLFRLGAGRPAELRDAVDEEIALHLEARARQLVARGWAPEEARAEARRRFGGSDDTFDEARRRLHDTASRREQRMRTRERVGALRRETGYVARALGRSPGFAAVAVATLALGIGANSAVFGLVSAVLLRPPPYADPGRLVMVWQSLPSTGEARLGASAAEYLEYRERNRVFSSLAGYANLDVNLTGDGEPERLQAARVTQNLFATLGARPLTGRGFQADEDRPGAARVVVLSHALWQRRFGGDPAVVGRTIRLDEQTYTVVGVMPRGFEFPWRGTPLSEPAELWMPMAYTPAEIQARAASFDTRMVARLAPGAAVDRARDEVRRIAADFRREHPDVYVGNLRMEATVLPLAADASARARPLLLTLLAAVGFVLLIACANVANLLLVRAMARRREVAVRRALGASAAQVARQALLEGLLLAAAGGALGLALAYLAVGLVRRLGPGQIAGLAQARIDARVLAFTALLCLGTALLCGLLPALSWARQDPQEALRHGGRSVGGGRERHRLRGALVVLEAASAMVLLVGAALLIRSFVAVVSVPPGFDPEGVLLARTTFNVNRYPEASRRRSAERAIVERLAVLPGVTAVGVTTHLPLADERTVGVTIEGRDPNDFHWAANALVTGDYFRAMRIPLRRGRTFGPQDLPDAPAVALVNETMARRYWPSGDAVGRAISWGGRRLTIVGVVGDVRVSALDAPVQPTVYTSLYQVESGAGQWGVFVVRTAAADPAALLPAVRRAIWAVDPDLPVFGGTTLRHVVARALATRRFVVALLSGFAAAALALALVGLYGVLAASVAQRTTELGVRLAVGARPADVLWLVLRSGLRLAALGVATGALLAGAMGAAIASLLFGVRPLDPLAYLGAAATLVLVSLAASYLPARRAARLDPALALRAE